MINSDDRERIEKEVEQWMRGELSGVEQQRISLLVKTSADYTDTHERLEKRQKFIDLAQQVELRQTIRRWQKRDRQLRRQRYIIVLAVLVLTIAGLIWWWMQSPSSKATVPPPIAEVERPVQPPTQIEKPVPFAPASEPSEARSEQDTDKGTQTGSLLLAEYYAFPIPSGTQRTRSGESKTSLDLLKTAMDHIDARNFIGAEEAFLDFLKTQPESGTAQYYLAHLALRRGEVATARTQFSVLRERPEERLRDAAEWYYALTLLPELATRRTELDQLLASLQKPENYHDYAEEAQRLAQDLGGRK